MKSSEANKEAGIFTINNGLHHDMEKSHESVTEYINGAFPFICY